jgi:hypothetical protein
MTVASKVSATPETLTVSAPSFQILEVKIIGATPYMQHAFPEKARKMIEEKHREGGPAKNKRTREARDFEAECEAAKHYAEEGWVGIPACAFRNAMISACRIVGFAMTKAKLSVFCLADGRDVADGRGLVRLFGTPEQTIQSVRNESGVVDLRSRPMWREWSAVIRIRYDSDQFKAQDVLNLIMRAGLQVGVGEGRPDSKDSAGLDMGLWNVEEGQV